MRSLVQIGIDGVTNKSKLEWKLHFLNEKHTLLSSILYPERWKSHFRALKFQKRYSGEARPHTPKKKGANGPLLIQSDTLFKPAGFFNFIETPAFSNTSSHASLSWVVQGDSWPASGGQCGAKYSPTPAYQNVCPWNLSSETFISNILSKKVLLITSFQPGDLSKVS